MFGAILGDIIGSIYEFKNIRQTDFPIVSREAMFTDDTVMTVATAYALLNKADYAETYKSFGRRYPGRGYGGRFKEWLGKDTMDPYNSFGNGSAMRVSPVAYACKSLEAVLIEAKKSAEATHNHLEGIKGAQSVASAIYLARTGVVKSDIKSFITDNFSYNLSFRLNEIRHNYEFDETCQGSVPQAIVAFLESDNYEDAVRKAVSIGGDSDTIACIAGSIAEAYYGSLPVDLVRYAESKLDYYMLDIIRRFRTKFMLEG